MILYLDTSAILKKYFKEVGSKDVISKWKEAMGIVTSAVAYAEVMASIHRKRRELARSDRILRKAIESFQKDWETFFRVAAKDDLNDMIDRVLAAHPLRGFDAIHLASALIVHENIQEDFLFGCFDERLASAAKLENLIVFPTLAS